MLINLCARKLQNPFLSPGDKSDSCGGRECIVSVSRLISLCPKSRITGEGRAELKKQKQKLGAGGEKEGGATGGGWGGGAGQLNLCAGTIVRPSCGDKSDGC